MRTCATSTLEKLSILDGFPPSAPTWLKLAISDCLHNKSISRERESKMLAALGMEPIPTKRYYRPCLRPDLSDDQKRRIWEINNE